MPPLKVFVLGAGGLALLIILLGWLKSRIRWGGRKVDRTTLRVSVYVASGGDVMVRAAPRESPDGEADRGDDPAAELGRLILHWLSEVLLRFQEPGWRVRLLHAAGRVVAHPLSPRSDVCTRSGLGLGWRLVKRVDAIRTEAGLDLYLLDGGEGRRQVRAYADGAATDAVHAASWIALLHFATTELSPDALQRLAGQIQQMLTAYAQGAADPDSKEDAESLPNRVVLGSSVGRERGAIRAGPDAPTSG